MTEEELSWRRLEQLGLAITHRQVPATGWGYTWRGGSWQGSYQTPMSAEAAAFSRAIGTLALSGQCPFPLGDCPLLRPPPPRFAVDLGQDEEEAEGARWGDEDRES